MSHISLPLAMVPNNQSLFHFTLIPVHLCMSIQCSSIVAYTVHGTYSGIVLDIIYTKEEDALIDTNQEAISYRSIYNHKVFPKEVQCS